MIVAIARGLESAVHISPWATTVSGMCLVLAVAVVARRTASTLTTANTKTPPHGTTYVNPMAAGYPVPLLPGQRIADPMFIIRQEDIDA